MMTLDVVNDQNEKVGSLDLDSTVFGGVVNTGLIWELFSPIQFIVP